MSVSTQAPDALTPELRQHYAGPLFGAASALMASQSRAEVVRVLLGVLWNVGSELVDISRTPGWLAAIRGTHLPNLIEPMRRLLAFRAQSRQVGALIEQRHRAGAAAEDDTGSEVRLDVAEAHSALEASDAEYNAEVARREAQAMKEQADE